MKEFSQGLAAIGLILVIGVFLTVIVPFLFDYIMFVVIAFLILVVVVIAIIMIVTIAKIIFPETTQKWLDRLNSFLYDKE